MGFEKDQSESSLLDFMSLKRPSHMISVELVSRQYHAFRCERFKRGDLPADAALSSALTIEAFANILSYRKSEQRPAVRGEGIKEKSTTDEKMNDGS